MNHGALAAVAALFCLVLAGPAAGAERPALPLTVTFDSSKATSSARITLSDVSHDQASRGFSPMRLKSPGRRAHESRAGRSAIMSVPPPPHQETRR